LLFPIVYFADHFLINKLFTMIVPLSLYNFLCILENNLRKINYPSIILEQNKLITYKWLKLKEYRLFQTIVKK